MSKKAMPIGTTSVALRFDGGAVLAADHRGTVDSDTCFYEYCKETEVPMTLGMLGTTRAATIAGPSGEVLRSIEGTLRDRLVEAEEAKTQLETVEESANHLCRRYAYVFEPPHVEMIVVGWDDVKKEGAPCISYCNDMCGHNVKVNVAAGPGRDHAADILDGHEIGMSEEEVVQLAEQAVLEGAIGYGKKEGSLDVWVFINGQIIKTSQLMTEVAKKYGQSL
ncbi:hypothetical protein MKW94_015811 [Papaver nudicaule]|uniref:Proteasome subunit beta n=1 Tax=Papaver nudicaule TaxID=74823 RepID=A0AA41UVG4_PAPNU|nr:hypothetical protein [Papaver nudicaule]